MSRKRFISTEISRDVAINQLAQECGDFCALLYTWLIPHAKDDGIVYGDPEEIRLAAIPAREDKTEKDVRTALDAMTGIKHHSEPLIYWDQKGHRIIFPHAAFYKYQSNIPETDRRQSDKPSVFDEELDADTIEKFEAVITILPTRLSKNARKMVKAALQKYPDISAETCEATMREVLDRFNTMQHATRTDWATLFVTRLGWVAEAIRAEQKLIDEALTPAQFQKDYENQTAKARSLAKLAQERLQNGEI